MLAGDAGRGCGGPPIRHNKGFRACAWPARLTRGCGTGSRSLPGDGWDVERIPLMDVAQSALPIASSDLSLIALFLQAAWIVKVVMLGLLSCSVWVWAIAIDKIFLYSRTKRAMDRFEQAFWSGQSIEELYRGR